MARKSGRETVRDMVLSLGACGLVVGALFLVAPHSGADPVKRVPYELSFRQAARVSPYPLLAPQGLSERWRATSVNFEGVDRNRTTWHIGFINPNDTYAAVEQTNGFTDELVRDKGKRGQPIGNRDVAGEQWKAYDGPKYRSLVRVRDGVTTMVTGNATFEDLTVLAASLRTAAG
ncbi:DUF4245 domain-containing protein [Embleya sp. NPDC008237]|uniref:DUF4245 domain-containing protein n=1 Tax=Embleya sp. NPDC008237 TaxID=3363978 RepID=UPI0036E4DD94